MTQPPRRLGVLGAGVMGAGIAQLGCLAGMETFLLDSSPEALAGGEARIAKGLERGAESGRWSRPEAEAALTRLRPVADGGALAAAELVVEAVPERLELKREALGALPDGPVIATNTSSLSVTEIAAGLSDPSRVVGMHFFNPPPLMRLVELIAGAETTTAALELARATAVAMGRTPIVARDAIGFVVNRCARPFYAEGMRLLEEGVADAAQIDRICRLGAGFRMGPFELMDLIGLDTSLAVAEAFTARSFGEPRWIPSTAQRRRVAAGRLGRKAGAGWFEYEDGGRAPDPEPPAGGGGEGRAVAILGEGPGHAELCEAAAAAGFEVHQATPATPPLLTVLTEPRARGLVPAEWPVVVSCAGSSLAAASLPAAAGFHLLAPLADTKLVELTELPATPPATRAATEQLFGALGLLTEWVGDAPGLVLGRVIPQLVNEACFAVGEGVASPRDVDLGLTLGVNYPRGPFEWGELLGWDGVVSRLDALWSERREERYRVAPLLRRAATLGISPAAAREPDRPHGAWQ